MVQRIYTLFIFLVTLSFSACNSNLDHTDTSANATLNAEDSAVVAQLFNEALTQGEAYDLLKHFL